MNKSKSKSNFPSKFKPLVNKHKTIHNYKITNDNFVQNITDENVNSKRYSRINSK